MPESFTHLFAKKLLAEWLRKNSYPVKMEVENDYRLVSLNPIRALVPATDPFKGVYEEYPICLASNGQTTLHTPWEGGVIPTYEELIARNQRPAYILDIAIIHMGQIKYGIEVVHRHDVTETKINMLRLATGDIPFELYKVDATWVLNHCNMPYELELVRLLPRKK